MKVLRAFTLVLSIVFLTLCSVACQDKGSAIDLYYFNTVIHIETYQTQISSQTEEKLKTLFHDLEQEFDSDINGSFVNKVNNAKNNEQILLSDYSYKIINECFNYYTFTNGKFNPAIKPLLELWQFAPNFPVINFKVPSEEQIIENSKSLNLSSLVIDKEQKTLIKTDENLKIDLGGIVKGYASDLASEILKNDGHYDGYINVGGSSLYLLNVESLSIKHPRQTDSLTNIINVNLKDKPNLSVSTSGDYERYYVKDGIRYSHLIDPATGKPTNTNVISVTIIGSNGTKGDAITTAACLFTHTPENASQSQLVEFLKKVIASEKCSVYAVYNDGNYKQIITNEKQGKTFTLLDDSYSVINI